MHETFYFILLLYIYIYLRYYYFRNKQLSCEDLVLGIQDATGVTSQNKKFHDSVVENRLCNLAKGRGLRIAVKRNYIYRSVPDSNEALTRVQAIRVVYVLL